jgi:hypothetical protein
MITCYHLIYNLYNIVQQGYQAQMSKIELNENKNRIRYITLIGLVNVILLVAILGLWLILPRLANHFYFALPISDPDGLPFRVPYNGRTYMNPSVCAGEGWCHNYKPECRTEEYLKQQQHWPLKQVGKVLTLFGPTHPIMVPAAYTFTYVVFVPYGNNGCYLNYGLEGGL